jgi:hypothetical protein
MLLADVLEEAPGRAKSSWSSASARAADVLALRGHRPDRLDLPATARREAAIWLGAAVPRCATTRSFLRPDRRASSMERGIRAEADQQTAALSVLYRNRKRPSPRPRRRASCTQ